MESIAGDRHRYHVTLEARVDIGAFHPDHIQRPILPPGTSVVIYDIDPDTRPAAIAAVLESGIDAYLFKATPPVLAAQIDALWRTTRRLGRDGQPGV